ncbi:nucleoside triphosphate pyrophosphohydrolase [bacterium]|nr:nucleoside triphosphate pyrophosphohydrolase [bacterium]
MSDQPIPIPQPSNPDSIKDQFESFVELVTILRRECPWDRKQTHESISHLFIEEAYEMIDAIEASDDKEFAKELGDLFLHIVMHAVIAEQRGAFSILDVMKKVQEKLIHRHPHVFGEISADDEETVRKNWEELKMQEGRSSALEGVPNALPALLRAQRIQEKAANVGFDWDEEADVWKKVYEEIDELRAELDSGNQEKIADELGDVLFSIVNAARFRSIIAEEALQKTSNKFKRRFMSIEQSAQAMGKQLKDMTLQEMDELWNKAKEQGL